MKVFGNCGASTDRQRDLPTTRQVSRWTASAIAVVGSTALAAVTTTFLDSSAITLVSHYPKRVQESSRSVLFGGAHPGTLLVQEEAGNRPDNLLLLRLNILAHEDDGQGTQIPVSEFVEQYANHRPNVALEPPLLDDANNDRDEDEPHQNWDSNVARGPHANACTAALQLLAAGAAGDEQARGAIEDGQRVHGERPDQREGQVGDGEPAQQLVGATCARQLLRVLLLLGQQEEEDPREDRHGVRDDHRVRDVHAHRVVVALHARVGDVEGPVDQERQRRRERRRQIADGRDEPVHRAFVSHTRDLDRHEQGDDPSHSARDLDYDRRAEPEPLVSEDVPHGDKSDRGVHDDDQNTRPHDHPAPVPVEPPLAHCPQRRKAD
ncbi:hypothetical protein ON010_g15561 [Phytophthora cinnamomi]|nr:hypothetical protein ON010_g15561 [Phytophthora cinnamomi]